ncbi:MAG: hypothetical protein H6741_25080 [Alphaproteobacteria bacterium]|nr:hypothetical protein [Alphaproteobacteria bacterium]MCB9795983.1 hypothetical protein [Alphaproteobacteria bacterium]
MPRSVDAGDRAWRAWVWLRLPVPLALGGLALALDPGLAGHVLTVLPYGHGAAKIVLGPAQTLLVRQPELPWILGVAAGLGLILPWLPARAAQLAAVITLLAAPLLLPHGSGILALLGALLLLAALRPEALERALGAWGDRLRWVPGVGLLLPGWMGLRLGLPERGRRALGPLLALYVAAGWLLADTWISQDRYAQAVSHFPTALTDPRAEVWGRAPPGQWCEFHDIDLVGDRLVVVAEASAQIRSYPLEGGDFKAVTVPYNWEPWGGLVLDAESDPATGRTFFLDGPHQVSTLRWNGRDWERGPRSRRIPTPLHHVRSRWFPEREELVMISINTARTPDPTRVVVVNTRDGGVSERELLDPDGANVPNIRELTWVDSLQRFALAPDFGQRLYLADPWTARAEPWVEVPTLNGKLLYSAERDELLLALPDQAAVLVIDPGSGAVKRRLPNQPGVRTMAVDPQRGWLLSGSVLTGAIWVQDLETGEHLDTLRTFQPMMREILLMPEQGIGFLTTWGSFYRFSYLPEP